MFALHVLSFKQISSFKTSLWIGCSLFLFGCKVGPDFHRPLPYHTAQYTEDSQPHQTVSAPIAAGQTQYLLLNKELPQQWWMVFHSPELNELIVRGMTHSPNIKAAQAALRQAQENLTAGIGTTFFPAVNAQLSGQRQKTNEVNVDQAGSGATILSVLNPAFNLTYNLDVFGGGRRTVEALCASVDYQRYQLESTYLILTTSIVTTALTEASLRAQIQATKALIDLNQKNYELLKQQFQLGAVSQSEVLTQRSQLAQTQATLPALEKTLAQTRHALAVLVGELPSESCLPSFELTHFELPRELPLGVPSTLIRKRPDIKAMEAALHQASAQIGVATANLFPQISLLGSFGWQSNQFSHLFNNSNQVWSYGGQILQPVFNGTALLAKRRAAIAAYDEALAQYQQTALQAYQNVADVLRAIEMDAKTLKAQALAEQSAKEALSLSEKQFQLGAINYLNLLQAQQNYQQTLIARIQAQAARYLDTAALFQALGGSWVAPENQITGKTHG